MTLAELKQLLDTTGYPVAYSHFNNTAENPPPSPPFITYLEAFSSNQFADNKVYKKVKNIQVELYTNYKDLTAESTLENVLDANEIPYETTEAFIESEQLFQKIYEIGVI
jgi:hypothetical protein